MISVLITGCPGGIGAATAVVPLSRGYTVYATRRRPQTLQALAGQGGRTLDLVVTEEESMAVAAVQQAEGSIRVLRRGQSARMLNPHV